MTWTRRTSPIKVGDRVAYSAAFLRSISCFAGDIPHGRGTVIALHPVCPEVILAEINWAGNADLPAKVNVRSLCRVQDRGFSHG
jgi:hypothetical protein